jgi:hypothetical protein
MFSVITNALKSTLETQEADNSYLPDLNKQLMGTNDIYKLLVDEQGKLNSATKIGQNLVELAGQSLVNYFQEQKTLLDLINQKSGLTGKLSKDFREEITAANPRLLQLGISYQDLGNAAEKLLTDTGKFNLINQQTFERGGEIAAAYVGTLSDLVSMYPAFEKVGLGAADAQEKIGAAGQRALELGLNSKKATKELSDNIGKLNSYGFKAGIDGLSSMVRKATEFRMSMNEVFTIADKVMNPEGAIDLVANLQVLGGAIGDFNDPLKLMYMATNNVEGLQDALIGAAGGLATYNQEQGKFEITGANLRRAKEMAAQLGINYNELANGAIAAAERSSAASEMLASGLNVSDEQKEFLTNISTMKGGKMSIELQGDELKKIFGASSVALEDLNEKGVAKLMEYQNEFKKMSTEDIVRSQATDIENIRRDMNYVGIVARNQIAKMGLKLDDNNLGIAKGVKATAEYTRVSSKSGGEIVKAAIDQVGTSLDSDYNKVKTNPIQSTNVINNVDPNKVAADNAKINGTNTTTTTNQTTTVVAPNSTTKVDLQISYKGVADAYLDSNVKGSYLITG